MADDHIEDDDLQADDDPLAPGGRLDVGRLIAENGDAKAALGVLARKLNAVEKRGANYRERIRTLEAQVPDEATAKAYEAYVALGTVEEIKAKMELLDVAEAATAKLAEYEREAQLAQVAEAAGVRVGALKAARGSEALSYRIDGEGEDRKVYVTPPGEGAEEVEFDAFADREWADLKPALYGEAEQPERDATRTAAGQRPFVVMNPGGRPPAQPKPDAEKSAEQKRRQPEYAAAF